MKIEELMQHWADITQPGVFQGYDSSHPLYIFYGLDNSNNKDFVLLSEISPERIPSSSRAINTIVTIRDDGKYAIHFQLVQRQDWDIFAKLCYDLAESTRNSNSQQDGIVKFLNRYMKWKLLLDRDSKGRLSLAEIKGLLGELLFIDKYLLSRYGADKCLQGWIGPNGSDRDFVFGDFWYESKAIAPGSATVSISSTEQLDTDDPGKLVLLTIENTTTLNGKSISLPSEIRNLRLKIGDDSSTLVLLESKLAEAGYFYDAYYDEQKFVFHNMQLFNVSNDFPRIRRSDLKNGIIKVGYQIGIDSIEQFEIKME